VSQDVGMTRNVKIALMHELFQDKTVVLYIKIIIW